MEYLVIFLNYDGKELYKTMVKEGETAVYQGSVPKKPNEEFVGWNKPLNKISDNLIVTAVFEKNKKGVLQLGAISFEEENQKVKVIEDIVLTNEDLYVQKDTDIDR